MASIQAIKTLRTVVCSGSSRQTSSRPQTELRQISDFSGCYHDTVLTQNILCHHDMYSSGQGVTTSTNSKNFIF